MGFLIHRQRDPTAKKIKLQQTEIYYVRIPARVIEHFHFKAGQLFRFESGKGYITYDPYSYCTRLIGVAQKKITVNNLPKQACDTNVVQS